MAASKSKGTYLSARYRRIASSRGRLRAVVALEHSILTAVWHMLANGEIYHDPGADHYTRIEPDRARTKAIRQLESLGYEVVITRTNVA